MTEVVKVGVPVILALVTAFGAHSCRVEYIKGEDQEKIGRVIMTMNKVCEKEAAHVEPTTTEP